MEFIKQLVPLLLTGSLAGLVLAVGLNTERGDLLYVFKRPRLLGRAVLAVMVIPPIIAGILVWILPVSPPVKAGIMLMAVAPVPPLVPGKELGIGGRKAYAYGVYVAMALLTIISVPLVFNVAAHVFGRDDTVQVVTILATVFTGVIIPLAIGLLVRRLAPALAARIWRWVYRLSMLLVVVAFVPILAKVWGPMMTLVGNGAVAGMALVALICLAGGHILGGPDRIDRATLATAASVRHPGIAMALASANMTDPRVTAAVLLFMLVGLVVTLPYTMWVKRTTRAEAAAAGQV